MWRLNGILLQVERLQPSARECLHVSALLPNCEPALLEQHSLVLALPLHTQLAQPFRVSGGGRDFYLRCTNDV